VTPSLVFTIDTEPDDQWALPRGDGSLPPFTFANTRGLGPLIEFFRRRGLPATWMVSYSVARDRESVARLREAARGGDEIAGHLHGWETPPFAPFDPTSRPFIAEYDEPLRLAKHRALMAAHEEAFGTRPLSYRAGRWGVDEIELAHIASLGYTIDSSIPPGIDFRDRGGLAALGPDFRGEMSATPRPRRLGPLWEVPASIVPLGPLAGATGLARMAARRDARSARARVLCRALAATRLQEVIWIRPLKHPRQRLVQATRALLRRGAPVVNVMFHSSEAFAGTSPLSRRPEDVERLYGDLDAIIEAGRAHGALGRTLREAVAVAP
jgi:hypothetical protein